MYKNRLPNGCSYSDLFIHPNLKTTTPAQAMKKEWYVGCKFYDPNSRKDYPNGFFWRRKGLAEYKTYKERKLAAGYLLDEMRIALQKCYNPIPTIREFQPIEVDNYSPFMSLPDALKRAFNDHKENITDSYAADIKSNLNKIDEVIMKLRFQYLEIRNVELIHIRQILDSCKLSNNSYNRYRTHLSVLFGILCANSCLIQNPCQYIPIKNHIKAGYKILSQEKFDEIYKYLSKSKPWFANYMNIFHMSGARSTELLKLKRSDVDLENQEYTITIKKRKRHVREIRAIITPAIPFWEKQIKECKSEYYYLFGAAFHPEKRQQPIYSGTPSKYWNKYVNKKFNTETSFYKLKHFFIDKVEAKYGIDTAQNIAGHLNGKTTEIYTFYKKQRELEELKSMSFNFAPNKKTTKKTGKNKN